MSYESKTHKDSRLRFRETCRSEQGTRKKTSDIGSTITWADGKSTGDGSANSFLDMFRSFRNTEIRL